MFNHDSLEGVGARIQDLRKRCGLSIRELARKAEISAAMLSYVERGQNSPSLATLQKLLAALDTDLAGFFADKNAQDAGPIFRREQMRVVADAERTYAMVLGRHADVKLEMLDEQIRPSRRKPEYETLQCDVAGYVLSGTLTLEMRGRSPQTLRPGDAFYVPKKTTHRGFATGAETVRLITVCYPAVY